MKKAYALEIMTCYCLRYSPKSVVEKDHLQKERKRERDTRSTAKENTNHAHANKAILTKLNQMEPKQIHAKRWANSRKFKTIFYAQGPVDSNSKQIYAFCHTNCGSYSHLLREWNRLVFDCRQISHWFRTHLFIQQGPAWAYHGFFMMWFCVCTAHVILMMIATKNS